MAKTNEQVLVELVAQLIQLTNVTNQLKKQGKEVDVMTKWQLNNVWSGLRIISKAIENNKNVVKMRKQKVA